MNRTQEQPDLFSLERSFHEQHPGCTLAGVDEAGRGPLAGPVVAAAVILPEDFDLTAIPVRDSKKLSAARREKLDLLIRGDHRIAWSIAWRTASEIDQVNILRATHECMRECIMNLVEHPAFSSNDCPFADPENFPRISQGMWHSPAKALVDGLRVPDFPVAADFVVKGDARSASIAAASILAKTWRDRYMLELDRQYPHYGFAGHKGYGTRAHYEALAEYGPCPEHRRSFTLVKEAPAASEQLFLPLS